MKQRNNKRDVPVHLPQAHLPDRRYQYDRPRDCRYCTFWRSWKKDCALSECWYLLPSAEARKEEEFDEDGYLIPDCRRCPYSRAGPCIGYCTVQVMRAVIGRKKGGKEEG